MIAGINEPLGRELCDLVGRTSRDIPLSDLFVRLLCGRLAPTAELLAWCDERGLEVVQTANQEFTFRKVRPVYRNEGKTDEGCGQFVGSLFEL